MNGHGTGRIVDPVDERDWLVRTVAGDILRNVTIRRRKLSLRNRLGPVLDQGRTPECVAHGAAVLKTFHERKDHRKTYHFNPHRLYAECKKRDGIPHLEGTYTRTVLDVLKDSGVGRRDEIYERDAGRFKISGYARVLSVEEIVRTLASIGPVLAGLDVFDSWFRPENNRWATPDHIPNRVYGHLVVICGFNLNVTTPSQEPEFEIRNSWGEDWADQGHCFMPFSEMHRQLSLPDYRSADVWSAVDVDYVR